MSQRDNVIKHSSENPFESMKKRFDIAAKTIGLDESDYHVLIAPQKTVIVNIPVTMDENERRWKVALDTYLHRVGRTGRFNTKGIGLNLVDEKYLNNINQIEDHYKCKIEEIKDMNDLIAEFKKLLNEF